MQGSNRNAQDKHQLSASLLREDTATALQDVCGHLGIDPASLTIIPAGADLKLESPSHVVLVEIGEDDPERMQALERFASNKEAGQSIIAILERPSGDEVRRLFRAGASDVLTYPVEKSELASALSTAMSQTTSGSGREDSHGALLAFLKTGGGVGATTMAVNVATELVRNKFGSVVLVDLDVQFGGVNVALDISPRLNFSDAVRAGQRLDGTMLQSMMTAHSSGIEVLPAAKSLAQVDVITEEFARTLCELLKQNYDYVIFDMPTCWTSAFYPILTEANLIVPVVGPTVRSADCARRIMQAIGDLGIEHPKMAPIANRAGKDPATIERLKKIGEILNAKIEFLVREDIKLAVQAADMGQTIRDVSASAGIANDFTTIAQKIHSEIHGDESAVNFASMTQPRKLFSFGGR